MAKLKYGQLCDRVEELIELSGAGIRPHVAWAINEAGRRIHAARQWHFRKEDAIIQGFGLIRDGEVDFTQESVDVVGGSTPPVWAEPASGYGKFATRKIARALGSPWYGIASLDGAADLDLDRVFLEADAADSSYVIYKDVYELPAAARVVNHVGVLVSPERAHVQRLGKQFMDTTRLMPGQVGPPTVWGDETDGLADPQGDPTADKVRRIRLWPVLDQPYGIFVSYATRYVDMTDQVNDVTPLPVELESLQVKLALLWAQQLSDARRMMTEKLATDLIEQAWREHQQQQPKSVVRLGFDAHAGVRSVYMDLSGLAGI